MTEMNEPVKRWIVVVTPSGERLLGWTPPEEVPTVEARNVYLRDAHLLLSHMNPVQGQQGLGFQSFAAMLPIDAVVGTPLSIYAQISYWYPLSEEASYWRNFLRLFNMAEDIEKNIRAQQAGLVTPPIHLPGTKH